MSRTYFNYNKIKPNGFLTYITLPVSQKYTMTIQKVTKYKTYLDKQLHMEIVTIYLRVFKLSTNTLVKRGGDLCTLVSCTLTLCVSLHQFS